jgi:hypothetical protein
MHLLPASLAILPGGEVPARRTCNGAAFFPVADNVRLPNAARRRVLVPMGPTSDVLRTAQPYLFQTRVGGSRLALTDHR